MRFAIPMLIHSTRSRYDASAVNAYALLEAGLWVPSAQRARWRCVAQLIMMP
jgi:hypothetical protein